MGNFLNEKQLFQKQVKDADYGSDVQTIKAEHERHQKEHKVIDQFQGNVEKCREAEVRFHGEELKIYGKFLTDRLGGKEDCVQPTFHNIRHFF